MIGAVLAVLGIVSLVVGIIVVMVLYNKRMTRLRNEWAANRGLEAYEANEELSWLRQFQAWGPGYGHRCTYGFKGTIQGTPLRVFQHRSKTRSKDSENVHHFTVCILEPPHAGSKLVIKREHIGHKLFDALGGEDIDFESDEFSRKFWVKSDNRRFAYDVITPRMMEFLLAAPKLHIEWQGNRLVLHVSGGFKTERADLLIDNGLQFLGHVPSHLN